MDVGEADKVHAVDMEITNHTHSEHIKLVKALDTVLARMQIFSTIHQDDIQLGNELQAEKYVKNLFYIIENSKDGIRKTIVKLLELIEKNAEEHINEEFKVNYIIIFT